QVLKPKYHRFGLRNITRVIPKGTGIIFGVRLIAQLCDMSCLAGNRQQVSGYGSRIEPSGLLRITSVMKERVVVGRLQSIGEILAQHSNSSVKTRRMVNHSIGEHRLKLVWQIPCGQGYLFTVTAQDTQLRKTKPYLNRLSNLHRKKATLYWMLSLAQVRPALSLRS